jgi:hypothetical protein
MKWGEGNESGKQLIIIEIDACHHQSKEMMMTLNSIAFTIRK